MKNLSQCLRACSVLVVCLISSPLHANDAARSVFVSKIKPITYVKQISVTGVIKAYQDIHLKFRLPGKLTGFIPDDIKCQNRHSDQPLPIADELQNVEKGDCLAALDMRKINIEIKQQKSTQAYFKKEYDRNATLKQSSMIEEAKLDQLQYQYETAKNKLQALEEEKNRMVIRAPFAGQIYQRSSEPNESINAFTTVLSIYNPKYLVINLLLSPEDITQVEPGNPCDISIESQHHSKKIAGIIERIGHQTIENTELFPVRIRITTNDSKLIKPGLLATVSIKNSKSAERKLYSIPFSSLRPHTNSEAHTTSKKNYFNVLTLNQQTHTVEKKEVQVIFVDRRRAYVEAQLNPDNTILLSGTSFILPGTKAQGVVVQ
jgi:RND family efflux transporter MFP subunit